MKNRLLWLVALLLIPLRASVAVSVEMSGLSSRFGSPSPVATTLDFSAEALALGPAFMTTPADRPGRLGAIRARRLERKLGSERFAAVQMALQQVEAVARCSPDTSRAAAWMERVRRDAGAMLTATPVMLIMMEHAAIESPNDPFAKVFAAWRQNPAAWNFEQYHLRHSSHRYAVTIVAEMFRDAEGGLEDMQCRFLRVGEITLVDQNFLPKDWSKETVPGKIIYLDGPIDFAYYVVPILIAMQLHRDRFKNAVVEDIGSGSGQLALVALALGASHVIGIDIKPEAAAGAMKNWEANPHLREGRQAQFITESVEHWLAYRSTGLRIPEGSPRIVVTNFGPAYKASHQVLTSQVARRRDYSLAIIGGLEGPDRSLNELTGASHFGGFWSLEKFHFNALGEQPPYYESAFSGTPFEPFHAIKSAA